MATGAVLAEFMPVWKLAHIIVNRSEAVDVLRSETAQRSYLTPWGGEGGAMQNVKAVDFTMCAQSLHQFFCS